MKKKVIVTSVLLVSVLIGVLVSINFKKEESSFKEKEDSSSTPEQIVGENTLSMMLETGYQSGNYNMTTQSSWPTSGYTFNATLSKCENGGELSWDDENKVVSMSGNMSDKCYVYFDKMPTPLADWVIEQYNGTQGNNNIYYHDSSLTNGAGDSSYRYAGASASVNNYLCIGSTATTCPDANLFRIIGVFNNQVKVIKATSIGKMAWDSNGSNTWSTSSLYTYLNETYAASLQSAIGTTLYGKIANATWQVGGNTNANISKVVPATTYTNEVTKPASSVPVTAKIGLMYASDYGFAAGSFAWTETLYNYDSRTSINWLFLGSTEWLVSRRSDDSYYAFRVRSTGFVISDTGVPEANAVRPVFYLESSATYSDGVGSSSDPIRIS